MHQFNLEGHEIKYKTVGRGNASSSRINLPTDWEGDDVAIVLLKKNNTKKESLEHGETIQ